MVAGLVALAGFVWLWWKGVPTLYQDSGAGPDARVQAVTGTRTALLVGLAGVGAVGALWLNNRTFRVTQLVLQGYTPVCRRPIRDHLC